MTLPDSDRSRTTRLAALAAVGVCLGLPLAAAAQGQGAVGWVRLASAAGGARSEAGPEALIDGRAETAFCLAGDAGTVLGQQVELGFTGQAWVDAVRVLPAQAPKAARVSRVLLEAGHREAVVDLAEGTVRLPEALRGSRLTVRPLQVAGEGKGVCFPDLVLVAGGQALSGPWLPGLNPRVPQGERLQGLWAAGPLGAPERFLGLFLDGSFVWILAPNDPGLRGRIVRGRWASEDGRLVLRPDGGGYLKVRQVLSTRAGGPALELSQTQGAWPSLAGHYRHAGSDVPVP